MNKITALSDTLKELRRNLKIHVSTQKKLKKARMSAANASLESEASFKLHLNNLHINDLAAQILSTKTQLSKNPHGIKGFTLRLSEQITEEKAAFKALVQEQTTVKRAIRAAKDQADDTPANQQLVTMNKTLINQMSASIKSLKGDYHLILVKLMSQPKVTPVS